MKQRQPARRVELIGFGNGIYVSGIMQACREWLYCALTSVKGNGSGLSYVYESQ